MNLGLYRKLIEEWKRLRNTNNDFIQGRQDSVERWYKSHKVQSIGKLSADYFVNELVRLVTERCRHRREVPCVFRLVKFKSVKRDHHPFKNKYRWESLTHKSNRHWDNEQKSVAYEIFWKPTNQLNTISAH